MTRNQLPLPFPHQPVNAAADFLPRRRTARRWLGWSALPTGPITG
jgi:hypothetical protein